MSYNEGQLIGLFIGLITRKSFCKPNVTINQPPVKSPAQVPRIRVVSPLKNIIYKHKH